MHARMEILALFLLDARIAAEVDGNQTLGPAETRAKEVDHDIVEPSEAQV